jgi:hypothetical protein
MVSATRLKESICSSVQHNCRAGQLSIKHLYPVCLQVQLSHDSNASAVVHCAIAVARAAAAHSIFHLHLTLAFQAPAFVICLASMIAAQLQHGLPPPCAAQQRCTHNIHAHCHGELHSITKAFQSCSSCHTPHLHLSKYSSTALAAAEFSLSSAMLLLLVHLHDS